VLGTAASFDRVFWYVRSVVAAAAENQDQGKDEYPGTAIVKDVAKTVVVIHKPFSS
jgi:hypothetical protein